MSSSNSALAAWLLTVIAVVAVGALAIWLTAVYRAAREPRWRNQPVAGSTASGHGQAEAGKPAGPGPKAAGHDERIAA